MNEIVIIPDNLTDAEWCAQRGLSKEYSRLEWTRAVIGGRCEHWIPDGQGECDPAKMTRTYGWGNREGDRDCMNPPRYHFVKKSRSGNIVNRFRACEEHRDFIQSIEDGWEPIIPAVAIRRSR